MSVIRYLFDPYGMRQDASGGYVAYEDYARLTRELAEAKARAGSANASLPDGWVAVPVEATEGMIGAACDAEIEPTPMWRRMGNVYRAMLSARPESPPNGLPSKESGNENH